MEPPTVESESPARAQPQHQQPQQQYQQSQPQPHQAQQQVNKSFRILIDWDDLSEKMAEFHYKDIRNFWLCGLVDENGRLLDITLEREQQQQQPQEQQVTIA
jgi:hypothetical protein